MDEPRLGHTVTGLPKPPPAVTTRAGEDEPCRFRLVRRADVTGVSGTGLVAHGVLWPDGTVDVRWRGERPSSVHWDHIDHALAIHGHNGATRIEWIDTPDGLKEAPTERPFMETYGRPDLRPAERPVRSRLLRWLGG